MCGAALLACAEPDLAELSRQTRRERPTHWDETDLPAVGPSPNRSFVPDGPALRDHRTDASVTPAGLELPLGSSRIGFRTVGLGWGTAAPVPRAAMTNESGAVQLRRESGVVEAFIPRSRGVEQRWIFSSAPEVERDLLVEVAVDGATSPTTSVGGLTFRSGAESLVYGHGQWIDASGRVRVVPAVWKDGRIALRVPAATVRETQFPAVLDPLIGPEIDAVAPGMAPAGGSQLFPSVGWNGTEWLAVWQDHRSNVNRAIFGARISAAGVVLDPFGVELAPSSTTGSPDVVWTGSAWLVVYEDAASSNPSVWAVLVSRSLTPIAGPVELAPATSNAERAARAACGPAECVVVFNGGFRSTPRATVQRIAHDLTLLGPQIVPVGGANNSYPAIAYASGRFLVGFNVGGAGVGLVRLLPGGTLLDAAPVLVRPASERPAIATDGVEFMIFYRDVTDPANPAVRAVRADAAGDLSPGSEVTVAAADPGWEDFLRASYADGVYWVSWVRLASSFSPSGTAELVRVSAATGVLDAPPRTLGPAGRQVRRVGLGGGPASIALTGTELGNVFGQRFDGTGAALDATEFPVATSAFDQQAAHVAYNGAHYLVVWEDRRALETTGVDIWGARVDASGALLDPGGIPISRAPGHERLADVVSGGSDFLVLWEDYRDASTSGRDVRAARVSSGGVVLDPASRVVSAGPHEEFGAAASWDGSQYLVSWLDNRSGSNQVISSRMSATGVLLDPAGIVTFSGNAQASKLHAAALPGMHVVAVPTSRGVLSAIRVTASGVVLDASPQRIAGSPGSITATSSSFVAVGEGRAGSSYVLGSGSMDPVTGAITWTSLPPSATSSPRAVVGWDGVAAVMVYVNRVGSTPAFDLTGRALGVDGVPLEASFVIQNIAEGLDNHDIAGEGGGYAGVVFTRYDPLAPYASRRLRFRRLRAVSFPDGTACSTDLDCASSFCVDGVCCDQLCGGSDGTDCRACSVAAGAGVDGVCAPIVAGTQCRASRDACDPAETCNGVTVDCPPDAFSPDGLSCADSNACNGAEVCGGGICRSAAPLACVDRNPCTTDACDPATGCTFTPVPSCVFDAGTPDAGTPGPLPACDPGRVGDCDGDPSNGCEQALDVASHCGACAVACPLGHSCRGGSCVDPVGHLAVSGPHACALRQSGAMACWGEDSDGQIGDGAAFANRQVTDVIGGHRFSAIATANRATCGVRSGDGAVFCWGDNAHWQLGQGPSSTSLASADTPLQVVTLAGAQAIAAGFYHFCAVLSDGRVACWGEGSSGELGDGRRTSANTPVFVSGISDAVDVSAGRTHTCVLHRDSTVSCFGTQANGELGDGAATGRRSTPYRLPFLIGVVELELGDGHSCARTRAGEIYCWGLNGAGQLGDGTTSDAQSPRLSRLGTGRATDLCAGRDVTCALRDTGVWCVGTNLHGSLGASTTPVLERLPVRVFGLTDAVHIACGMGLICALRATGSVDCWGHGAMGDGNFAAHPSVGPVGVLP